MVLEIKQQAQLEIKQIKETINSNFLPICVKTVKFIIFYTYTETRGILFLNYKI